MNTTAATKPKAVKTFWVYLCEGNWTLVTQDENPAPGQFQNVWGPYHNKPKARKILLARTEEQQRQRDEAERDRVQAELVRVNREKLALAFSAKERFTLADLSDKQNMLAFLNRGGDPPTVSMDTVDARLRWGSYGRRRTEIRPVTDVPTLDIWWSEYRRDLSSDFQTSPLNKHKALTDKRFMTECLASLGIKGGTVEERKARAVLARPDLYISAETAKALEAEREAARRKAKAEFDAKQRADRIVDAAFRAVELARKKTERAAHNFAGAALDALAAIKTGTPQTAA